MQRQHPGDENAVGFMFAFAVDGGHAASSRQART